MPAPVDLSSLPASTFSGVTKSGIANLGTKVASDVAATGAASLGLGTLLSALGPAYSIYGALEALGFFDKGMEATPMTPEERAKFEAESRLALASSGLAEGGEGAYETLMDALAQASDTEGVSEQEVNEILGASGFANVPTLGGSTEPTLVEMTQEKINKAASAVGKAQDTVFDIFGIPRPDYSVIQPNAPGGTVIWGEPSGGVFGRIGTTPGGTVTGVQTGIPALDILMGKVADVVSGRAAAGEVLTTETITDIIVETAKSTMGVTGDTDQIIEDIKEVGKTILVDSNTGKLIIDPTAGGDETVVGGGDDKAPTLDVTKQTAGADTALTRTPALDTTKSTSEAPTVDRVASLLAGDSTDTDLSLDRVASLTAGAGGDTDLSLDRVLSLTTDRTTGTTPSLDRTPTLTTDRTGTLDPTLTERAPTLSSTSDRADEVPDGGSVGGVGLGEEGGVRIVSGAPGDAVDIDYLFDIGGESIFAPTLEDEEDKYRPYVYAKSGGMISTYDPVDELIRLLNQRY